MGLKKIYLDFIDESIKNTLGDFSGKRMLELGDQEIFHESIPEKTGKNYYKNRGIEHTSTDLNGLNGALKLDLCKPEQFEKWNGYFDIITNAGTTEHVEPKNKQYECFMIIHNCLKVGGIVCHLLPDIEELNKKGLWRNHCNNYYSKAFFEMLAHNNGYEIISLKIINELICVCLKKNKDCQFMLDRNLLLNHITRKKGGIIYNGINNKGIMKLFYFPCKIFKKLFYLFRQFKI